MSGIGIGMFFGFSSGGNFNPRQISGLVAWYDADAAYITKDGSDKVSAWADRSGNGYNLAQATPANQPTWTASTIGGKPGVVFDGAASPNHDLLISGNVNIPTATGVTWILVLKDTTTATCVAFEKSADINSNVGINTVTNATAGTVAIGWSANAAGAVNVFTAVDTLASGVILVNRVDATQAVGSEGAVWINGTSKALTMVAQNNTTSGFGNNALHFGARSTGAVPWAGTLCEFLLYDTALSAANRDALETYLGAKYGITVA